MFNLCDILSL